MQPAEVEELPIVSDGVPGYDPPSGPGYRTLRDGEVVFVPTSRTSKNWASPTWGGPSLPSSSISDIPAGTPARVINALTQPGPSVPGWSWQVRKHKTPAERMLPQAVSPLPSLLENSFAMLSVSTEPEGEQVYLARKAYTAVRYGRNPSETVLDGLREDLRSANTAFEAAREACTPYPSVDPPYQAYFVDPNESPVMSPILDDGSSSGEEEIPLTKVD